MWKMAKYKFAFYVSVYVFRRIVKARKVDVKQCDCIVTLSIVVYVENIHSLRNRPEMLTKDSHR
jgi:hypothetical protein